MPYKDPERKRQWERAHRQERTERRKLQRHSQSDASEDRPTDDDDDRVSPWAIWAVAGMVVSLLAFFFFASPRDASGPGA